MRVPVLPLALLGLAVSLSGCSASFAPEASTTSTTSAIGHIHGVVHGGRQPIVGASVYALETNLLAYSTAAAPAASTSQITVGTASYPIHTDSNGFNYILTDATGGFDLGSDSNTCVPGGVVYLYITGGDPGAGINVVSGLLAVLGVCPASGFVSDTVTTGVDVNELTTIAAAYTLAPFATDALHIGAPVYTSSSHTVMDTAAATALQNSAILAGELVTLSSGVANMNTASGSGILPYSIINTLGNILAGCINSTGNTTGPVSATCSADFSDVYSGGATGTPSTQATDTASLAIFMAKYPFVTSYIIPPALGSPYEPSLYNAPGDYTLGIIYTPGNNPLGIAIDGTGNAWVSVNNDYQGGGSVAEITSAGVVSNFTSGGISAPVGVAVDQAGYIWVTDPNVGVVVKLNPDGSQATGNFTSTSIFSPWAVAIDAVGNAYISDVDNEAIYYLNAAGGVAGGSPILNGSGYTYNGRFSFPTSIALDATGNIWVADNAAGPGNGTVYEMAVDGTPISGQFGYGYAIGTGPTNGIFEPYTLAFDSSSNAWIANTNSNLTKLSDDGTTSSVFSYLPDDAIPSADAIDGNGNAWITSQSTSGSGNFSNVFEFDNNGNPITPLIQYNGDYASSQLQNPGGIAIDGSGNVWIANSGSASVVELIGAAGPTLTPLCANLAPGKTPASKP